jgi:hypothetical protein
MSSFPNMLQMKTTVGWNDLRPRSPTTLQVLTELASRLNAESVLYVTTAIDLMLSTLRGPVPLSKRDQQIALARELLPMDVIDVVSSMLQSGDVTMIFHQEQLLLTARIAIEFGLPGSFQMVDRDSIGELLLRVNDCLLIRPARTRDDFVAMALRQLGAFSHEQERYLLARFHDLLVTRPRQRQRPSQFDSAFEAFSGGLSIDSFLALGFAYIGLFAAVQHASDLAGFDRIVLQVEERLRSSPEASRVRDLLTADPGWYRKPSLVASSLLDLSMTNLVGFFERPFVRLSNGSALPLSLHLALERLSSGIYWSAFTARRRDKSGVVDLNAYLGDLFQEYITEAAVRAYGIGGRHVAIPEAEIRGHGHHIACPDLVLLDGAQMVSIETTVTSLKMSTLVAGDVAEYKRELRNQKLKRKLMQPVVGATNLLNDTLTHTAFDPERITDIYPVLLMLWPFPQFVSTRAEVDKVDTVPSNLMVKGRRVNVHPLQFLSTEEFEMLEPGWAMGAGLSQALADKDARDPHHNTSMKNYMLTRIAREHENPRMFQLYQGLMKASEPILRAVFDEMSEPS